VSELLLVIGLTGSLVGSAAIFSRTPWHWLFGGGLVLVIGGLLLGVPTGLWYHVLLHRALRKKGPLPAAWWLRPNLLHDALSVDERRQIMRPFYAGAAGFALSLLGCVFVAAGAFRAPPG